MLRRLFLVLMLLAGLVAVPLARASQACCEQGCDHAMPACVAVCALCANVAALPAPEPMPPAAAPTERGPSTTEPAFDDWMDEIWNPPD